MRIVIIKRFPRVLGMVILTHIAFKLRQNNFHILQFFHPNRIPFQCNETVKVDRTKRQHYFVDRQFSVAHQAIGNCPAVLPGIFQMHMANIRTQILDRLFRSLIPRKIGGISVPQGGNTVTGKVFEYIPQRFGIGKQSAGFQQKGYAVLFCHRQNLFNKLFYMLHIACLTV